MSRLGYVMHLYLGEFVVQKNFQSFSLDILLINRFILKLMDGWKEKIPIKGFEEKFNIKRENWKK